jgi:hypothetical protein
MLIAPDMDLNELVPLMGIKTRYGFSEPATLSQASDLRDLLVRDFLGQDTSEIAGLTWHLYCCAVDPEESN